MMIRDFKYIIKRIIIGVGITLSLIFIKGNFLIVVNAKEISSVWAPFSSTNSFGLTNLTDHVDVGLNRGYWVNWGSGKLRFNFTLIKVSGSATDPLVVPQNVIVNNYLCDISSTSTSNSTFTGQTYTAICPMIIGSDGLATLSFFFTPNQQNGQSGYRLTIGNMFTFEKDDSLNFDTSGTTNAINNQINNDNTNTQNIINNQNQNTQDVIDNQNSNTASIQQTIDDNLQTCVDAHTVYPTFVGVGLSIGSGYNGVTLNSNNSGGVVDVSRYVGKKVTITFDNLDTSHNARNNYCFTSQPASSTRQTCLSYHISGSNNSSATYSDITVPQGAKYLYLVGYNNYVDNSWISHSTVHFYRACFNKLDDTNSSINNINNTLTNDDITGANSEANSFFSDFQADSHGLSGIITSPLRLIQSLSSSTCSSLVLPLPFVSQNASLPCMSTVYNQFPTFYSLWQLITTGLICYWILIKLYGHVKGMQNPKDDRIEVLQL